MSLDYIFSPNTLNIAKEEQDEAVSYVGKIYYDEKKMTKINKRRYAQSTFKNTMHNIFSL